MSVYRTAAAASLGALAANVSDRQAVGAAAAGMLDVLDGKVAGGKPKSAPERSGMLAGLQALAAAPGSNASMHETAEPVVGRLLSAYKAEANEEVRRCWPWLASAGARARMQEHGMVIRRESFMKGMWCMLQVKLSMVAALEPWLQRMQQLPETVLAHFRSGLREKEALRRAHLRCLAQVNAGAQPCMVAGMLARAA